ncbi:MAG: TonB-dependent receptor plug domain-containing protein [Burkholderiaceae bacterium]
MTWSIQWQHQISAAGVAGLMLMPIDAMAQHRETLLAQSGPETVLRSLVVTGTRTEQDIDEASVRTEVVSRVEIERTGARTVGEAIENLTGMSLSEIHGKSGYQVSIQGLTSDQVLVLIDGLNVTPSTGSTVDLSQLLLGDIERIEVLKGASSMQYGSAAMGGVINIITRPIRKGLGARIEAGVGSRGSQNVSGRRIDVAKQHLLGSIEGGANSWRWRLAADGLHDDGFALDPQAWARQGDQIRRDRLLGRIGWYGAGESQAYLQASHYQENDVQRFDAFYPPVLVEQRKTEAIERRRLSAGWHWDIGGGKAIGLKALDERYDSESNTFSQSVRVIDRDASVRMNQLSAQVDLPMFANQIWQAGVDIRREQLSQTNNGIAELGTGIAQRRSDEVYWQDDVFLSDTLNLNFGARWQRDDDFGSYVAPKLSLRHEAGIHGQWRMINRLSIGKGYRVPNLKERFFLFDHSAFGYVVQGNPNLQPERSNSFQLGTTLIRGHGLRVEIGGFYNRVSDLIQIDTNPLGTLNGVQAFQYRNIARARTSGFETDWQWQVFKSLSLGFGYTLTRSRDLDTGSELTRRPTHMSRLSANWQISPTTELVARARFQSSELVRTQTGEKSPEWSVLDLSLSRSVSKRASVTFSVRNVLDTQRDFGDPNDFGPRSGRLVSLAMKIHLGNDRPARSAGL